MWCMLITNEPVQSQSAVYNVLRIAANKHMSRCSCNKEHSKNTTMLNRDQKNSCESSQKKDDIKAKQSQKNLPY